MKLCIAGVGWGWAVLYYWEKLGNSLQLHSGPLTLAPDEFWTPGEQTPQSGGAPLQKRKWRGGVYGPTGVSQGWQGQGPMETLVAQYSPVLDPVSQSTLCNLSELGTLHL